jgi:hypothetical protein
MGRGLRAGAARPLAAARRAHGCDGYLLLGRLVMMDTLAVIATE